MTWRTKSRDVAATLLTLGTLALNLLIPAPICSQVVGATLSGTVTDPSGAVIANVQLSIKNIATGITTMSSTNEAGFYTAPNLLPGTYEITSSAPGFRTQLRTGITLAVGAEQVLNIPMQVGPASQTVRVSGEAPAVQLASSSLSAVVGSNAVVELPLNGRDWTQLGGLQPGVNVVVNQVNLVSAGRGPRGYGRQLTISGTRPAQNNYRLDGISVVDYANGAPGSSLGVALGVDAVEEFSVLTANYSAEYGRTSGGVVNAITRSGTNQIHGDAYWFLRDEGLDARNFFDTIRPPFHRNQFGASVGGPIQKDKTFFFFDYEGVRQVKGIPNIANVFTQNARKGDLFFSSPAAFPSGCVATGVPNQCHLNVDPKVQPYLAFWPLPNVPQTSPTNSAQWNMALTNRQEENFETARIDRNISQKDKISGTWLHDKATFSQPDVIDNVVTGNRTLRDFIALEESHVFNPSLLNSLRGGYHRVDVGSHVPISPVNPLATDTTLGVFPGQTAPSIGSIPGISPFEGGLGGGNVQFFTWNSFQGYDDAFLKKGAHSFKFGFAFEYDQQNFSDFEDRLGAFQFNSIADFLANRPQLFRTTSFGSLAPLTPRYVRQNIVGAYFQDDWLVRPNLTLNLGLRYETSKVPIEKYGRLTHLPTLFSATPLLGSPYFSNPTRRNFEPRVGFAWDPFHNGKTAVRGAFGIFDVLPLNYNFYVAQTQDYPFALSLSASGIFPQGSFPTGVVDVISSGGKVDLTTATANYLDSNPHRNYLMIWNLNIQRQFTPSTTLTVGYVGNRGVHMVERTDDANGVLPTPTAQGLLWPSPRNSGTRFNPNWGRIYYAHFGGDSFYDALEVQVSKRMSHGFQAQGSYTWAKSIDTGSTNAGADDSWGNSAPTAFWYCKRCVRGVSDFKIAHTFAGNYVWYVPSPKNWGGIGSRVLGGWELGGIITAHTGLPFTVRIGGDPLGLKNNRNLDYPNRLSVPGCSSGVTGSKTFYINLNCFAFPSPSLLLGNSGRNPLVGPGFATFDFSAVKNNYIKRVSEAFNVQFRAEFFNFLNRANFAPPSNNTLFDVAGNPVTNAGRLSSTLTDPRDIQFALKLIW